MILFKLQNTRNVSDIQDWIKVCNLVSVITLTAGAVLKYCDEYVCVSVCICLSVSPRGYPRNHIRNLYLIFVHVAYGHGSVLLRRRCDALINQSKRIYIAPYVAGESEARVGLG